MVSAYLSETSKHRVKLAPFCTGYGLDIGFGGDAINDSAIRLDFPLPYAHTGANPVQLGGDCRSLKWFQSRTLDYVYSSHVLEDFPERETGDIIQEWSRVLKPGGRLVLLLPDQQKYLAHCRETNAPVNSHHAIDRFSALYIREIAENIPSLTLVECNEDLGDYSFYIVFEKRELDANIVVFDALDAALQRLTVLEQELQSTRSRLDFVHHHPLLRPFIALRRKFIELTTK